MLLLLSAACLTLLSLLTLMSARSSTLQQVTAAKEEAQAKFRTVPDHERDTVILYRIIGNDLPPRHAPNQTLSNLRFLLKHESNFTTLTTPNLQRIEKYFVLNRIVSDTLLSRVKSILQEFNVPQERILEIPFEWEEYEQRQMRWDSAVADATGLWGIGRPPSVEQMENELQDKQLTNQTFMASALDLTNGIFFMANVRDTVEATERLPSQKGKRKQRVQSIGKLRAIDYTFHDKNLYAINNVRGWVLIQTRADL